MHCKDEQPSNTLESLVKRESGRVADCNDVHDWNAFGPRDRIPSGITIDLIDEHPLNRDPDIPIIAPLFGNVKDSRFVQPKKTP